MLSKIYYELYDKCSLVGRSITPSKLKIANKMKILTVSSHARLPRVYPVSNDVTNIVTYPYPYTHTHISTYTYTYIIHTQVFVKIHVWQKNSFFLHGSFSIMKKYMRRCFLTFYTLSGL